MRNISLYNILASDTSMPAWVVSSFPIINIVLAVLIAICAILITILVMCQKTEDGSGSSNAITGQADTFYNRNKGGSLQGKIKKATIALGVIIFVLCITFVILNAIYSPNV